MELLKLLSANEVVAQIVNFLLVLFLLRIFAWKKFLTLLDQRKEKIASELQRIEQEKEDMAKMKHDYELKMKTIEYAARSKIQEAVAEGEKIMAEIREKAYQDAAKILEDGKKDISYEIARSREELKEEIVKMIISVSENVIMEKLTPDADRRLVENFLKNIDKIDER
jgi:F-type H+-transporting ATPase subunit b